MQFVLGKVGSEGADGALIALRAGCIEPIPFGQILDPATGKTAIRRVDVRSETYASARAAMTVLEGDELTDPARLRALAEVAGMTESEFVAAYSRAASV